LALTVDFLLGLAVFAPQASYFSFNSKRKVTKRMPSHPVCHEKSARGAWIFRCYLRAVLMRHPGAQD